MTFVDKFVNSNMVLGLGSGELVNLAIEEVGRRLSSGLLEGISAVPACDAAAHEAAFHGVPLLPDDKAPVVDLLFDEADQIDLKSNTFIKGLAFEPQQPQLPRLRIVAARATNVIVLVNGTAVVPRLSGSLPVWLEEEGWEEAAEELDDVFLGDAEIWRRGSFGLTDDPKGGDVPYASPDGHAIVDVRFYETLKLYGEDEPYIKIAAEVENVFGVVTHGLLAGVAKACIIARENGAPEVVALM